MSQKSETIIIREIEKLCVKEMSIEELGKWFEKKHPSITWKVTILELIKAAEWAGISIIAQVPGKPREKIVI